eukprot:9407967-Pyramimonas_sp.AAC.1
MGELEQGSPFSRGKGNLQIFTFSLTFEFEGELGEILSPYEKDDFGMREEEERGALLRVWS